MTKLKVLYVIICLGLFQLAMHAQRGVRIGYIDTEYILQNVPEYQEASTQLDKKIMQWKSEIEKQLNAVEQDKKELENERVLLTAELYEERLEDIKIEEEEILKIQQQRFGPEGDLMIQKRQLIEPIQDQIFAAVQEIAELKKFDFVFDRSADVVMLYSAERFDISEQVLRTITRSSRRNQISSRAERKALEEEAVVPEVNEGLSEREQEIEDRKTAREAELEARRAKRAQALEDRKRRLDSIREARKLEAQERRQRILDERASRNDNDSEEEATSKQNDDDAKESKKTEKKDEASEDKNNKTAKAKKDSKETAKDSIANDSTTVKDGKQKKKASKTKEEILEEQRQQKIKDREARQKALEERKKRIIEQRRKAREERVRRAKKRDSLAKVKRNENNL